MGLSSSQARLLSLTGRMHDIEYKAQKIQAQKLQMANESTAVYKDYENALNLSKIQHKIIGADGSANFIDSTYRNLIGASAGNNSIYTFLDVASGATYVPTEIGQAYRTSNRTLEGFLHSLDALKSTTSDSYTSISSVAELKALSSSSSGSYRLDADLILENWSGITNFKGTFDGNGHTITIKSGTQGLFASTNGGTIINTFVDGNIDGGNSDKIGLLVGYADGTKIDNSYTIGSVDGAVSLGGLLGAGFSVTITNSGSSADVSSNYTANYGKYSYDCCAGGLVGIVYNGSTITNSIAKGDVSGEYWNIGGLYGAVADSPGHYGSGGVTITNCESYGDVYANKNGDVVESEEHRVNHTSGAFGGIFLGNISHSNSFGAHYNNGVKSETFVGDKNAGNATVDNCYGANGVNCSSSTSSNMSSSSPISIGNNPIPSDYPNLNNNPSLDYYIEMFKSVQGAEDLIIIPEGMEENPEWLVNMIQSGQAILSQKTIINQRNILFKDVNVATDTNLQEVQDKTVLMKAEAKYEADMRKINQKDKKFDTDIAALESERGAIKTEIDTLKSIVKDNVDRTFKLFS